MHKNQLYVTTHKGGVDWNLVTYVVPYMVKGHHPQGWCGLKSTAGLYQVTSHRHHPQGWCGLKLFKRLKKFVMSLVTTHKGGVDWNYPFFVDIRFTASSPPTRVVWIEILLLISPWPRPGVTTHKGGVDWNLMIVLYRNHTLCHHPQGWCGLKLTHSVV